MEDSISVAREFEEQGKQASKEGFKRRLVGLLLCLGGRPSNHHNSQNVEQLSCSHTHPAVRRLLQEGGKDGQEGVKTDLQAKVRKRKLQRWQWSEKPSCCIFSFLLLSGKKETFQRGGNMSKKNH